VPGTDTLLPAIKRLISDMVTEIGSEDTTTIDEYLGMAQTSPIVGSALQVITQLAVMQLGEFTHEDPDIQDFIRQNFEQMIGSLALTLEEMMSCFPLGRSVAQWGVEPREGKIHLIDVIGLHPALYSFEGRAGQITSLIFKGDKGDIKLPYSGEESRVIHAVNGRHLSFRDPYGLPALRRVKAAHAAWQIVIGEMLVAAQRQATPIVVGYSDSGVSIPMLDSQGQPLLNADGSTVMIQAPSAMLSQLESLDNRSVISTDIKNRIEALTQQTNGTFFFDALKLLQQLQLIGLLFPESILTATGVGDSNLNTGHRTTLGLIIESLVNQIKEVILNGPVRWLITWNFGDKVANFGAFPTPELQAIDPIALFTALNNAVSSGFFSAADLSVVNKGRDLVGLPQSDQPIQLSRSLNLDYWRDLP
jgi:hypothetical protein